MLPQVLSFLFNTPGAQIWAVGVASFLNSLYSAPYEGWQLMTVVWTFVIGEVYLHHRQLKVILTAPLPKKLQKYWTTDHIKDLREYEATWIISDVLSKIFKTVLLTIAFYFGWIRDLWHFTETIYNSIGLPENCCRNAFQLISFALSINFLYQLTSLLFLLLDWCSTFLINSGGDCVKSVRLKLLFSHFIWLMVTSYAVLMTGIGLTWNWTGTITLFSGISDFSLPGHPGLWILIGYTIFEMWVYCHYELLDFVRITRPLQTSTLKTKIDLLAQRVGFPAHQIVIRKSCRWIGLTGRSANFSGFLFSQRIHLGESLNGLPEINHDLQETGLTEDEVVAIVAHEMGHWKCRHSLKMLLICVVSFAVSFHLYCRLETYLSNGQLDAAVHACIYLFLVFGIVKFIFMTVAKMFEYEADRFAASLGFGKALLTGLFYSDELDLRFPLSDNLYSAWYHTHPTTLERMKAVNEYIRQKN